MAGVNNTETPPKEENDTTTTRPVAPVRTVRYPTPIPGGVPATAHLCVFPNPLGTTPDIDYFRAQKTASKAECSGETIKAMSTREAGICFQPNMSIANCCTHK